MTARTNRRRVVAGALAAVVLGGMTGWVVSVQAGPPVPQTPTAADKQVVAEVNNQPITRQELAEDLIARYGKEHLEKMINRRLIEQAGQRAGVAVTDDEVEKELRTMMRAGGFVTATDFERNMLRPRHLTLLDYKEDVVRLNLIMRKVAGTRIQITDEDLKREFESRYGEKVQCRMIVCQNNGDALKLHGQIGGRVENFLRAARSQANANLAAVAGEFAPVSRYQTYDIIEQRAFQMQDGEVSEVLQAPEGGYVILLREHRVPADTTKQFDQERELLRTLVIEKKCKQELPKLFQEVRTAANVQDYLNNKFDIKAYMERLGQLSGRGSP
jgi:hypothetical protein